LFTAGLVKAGLFATRIVYMTLLPADAQRKVGRVLVVACPSPGAVWIV